MNRPVFSYSGSESYYGKALKERRKQIFLTSKSHARDRVGALSHLQQTLKNMRTPYLDLWQVHDVRTKDDINTLFGKDGAIHAFVNARKQGYTRFIGITGHQDPAVVRKCMELFEFDTVLMPVNPAEPASRSFLEEVLPVALEKNMGIIGMKVYLRGLPVQLPFYASMKPFLHYALRSRYRTWSSAATVLNSWSRTWSSQGPSSPFPVKNRQASSPRSSHMRESFMMYKP